MKRYYSFFLTSVLALQLSAQDYTLNPSNLNVQGNPGDFMLSTLIVNNTSGNNITMHLKRIVKNLPTNWSSCFCYPKCLAPFIDTLTFNIAPFSMDSIKPNYGTDSVPGIGYVTITLYQQGFSNNIDTIAFSGSTLSTSGVNDPVFSSKFTYYPNPFSNSLTIQNNNAELYALFLYNSTGGLVYRKESISSVSEKLDLEFLECGIYYLKSEFASGKIISNKLVKSK